MIDNLFLDRYRFILFIIPFLIMLLLLENHYASNMIKQIKKYSIAIINSIQEKSLNDLISANFMINSDTFQLIRILVSIIICLCVWLALDKKLLVWQLIIMLIIIYKFCYLYLKMLDQKRKKHLSTLMPYCLKSIIYLCYIYPVNNALAKSINYVPDEFKDQLSTMVNEIDNNPTSFQPYQRFIDPYQGKMVTLNMYMHVLFRISQSSDNETSKLLSSINQSVSDELNMVRGNKNKTINDTIQYLGLIPVVLVTLMLGYLLVMVSGNI